ncbi:MULTISPECIES: aminopeptidase [unclassified Paenibacillus]|uniref:aminopeptidase n=1 Tax=unclassified Paenibacillus TaxID=185978 RepID=UPI001AE8AC84|nr:MULTISPECIES: aminopeptidase [unclassified Paenibacillus]MBP1155031.1 aminopeptidase [Paenibacillus sp. PvP091]MBP1169586.1 aminopeptidase [Paenibacillus sp. PvR098]MBP2440614.1 aminopeptidase [Paenibacillus sp. PvP052]
MLDPRIERLADVLVNYSTRVQPGENVLVEAFGIDNALVKSIVQKLHEAGGRPFVNLRDHQVTRELLMNATEEQIKTWAEFDAHQMTLMQAYIGVRGGNNIYELSDVPDENMKLYNKFYNHHVHSTIRVKKTKWVVLRYPTPSMSQLASMSTEAFEKLYFDVCTMDYSKMSKAMDALVDLMNTTDKVHLKAAGTDLTFSIKDIPAIKCAGEMNIPDGEVFTAPVRESVNGVISYNTPSPYNGFVFENVKLRFENGKIIEATANDTERINQIFDTDDGARFVGEFAIGVNPYILNPMKDILFDEKIAGSIHFTPGQAYDEADNGNRSSIHWDLVLIQRPEYGGGEIYFDDQLIRKDGLFVIPELEPLNPENLK